MIHYNDLLEELKNKKKWASEYVAKIYLILIHTHTCSFCRCAGATNGQLTVFLLKEIIDKAIDFIEASTLSSSSSSTNYASSYAQPAICDDIKYDHGKTAAAVVTSINVGLRMHKTWGVTDFET